MADNQYYGTGRRKIPRLAYSCVRVAATSKLINVN